MKGCSSLGLLRVAAIVALEGKRGRDYALLDLKEAAPSVAPTRARKSMPADDGERVVAGARALSPHLGRRMVAARALGKALFVRELAPQDLKIEIDQFSKSEAVRAARHHAFVVGKAHARQLDEKGRAEWLKLLAADRKAALDAPSWLWESVVSLAASHEAGYLEHCRRYALAA